jgi:RNA polymerase sigma-70 factor (ECF subfamily)
MEAAMSDAPAFASLIQRIRAGDPEAATNLVRQYEPTIRRVIRFRLVDARLGAAFDSMDICQSVLASFFVRTAAGQFEFHTPDDLVKLLVTMARNKLASQARKERAERRDHRRALAGVDENRLAGRDPTASQQVAAQELLQEIQRRLTPEERQLVELRHQGQDWAAIAEQLGETPVVLRKRLSRALDRVTRALGLDESTYE